MAVNRVLAPADHPDLISARRGKQRRTLLVGRGQVLEQRYQVDLLLVPTV